MPSRITVLGAGSWGTAYAKVLADAGNEVTVLARRTEVAEALSAGSNPGYLPDVALPRMRAVTEPGAALDGAELVVLAVPSQSLRENLAAWRGLLPPDVSIVSLAKGIELGTLQRCSEVIADAGAIEPERIIAVSGPNLAREVAAEQPTAVVYGAREHERAVRLQELSKTAYFRPYTNQDVIGCEIGGACKNVIALACGIATGLGFGANTTATLVTRGLAEITRLAVALGADPMTLSGLAGLGDLVATCSSPLSRNRTFGTRLAAGETVAMAQKAAHGQVAEGVKSCSSARELGRRSHVDMPIADVVHRVCHEGAVPRAMVAELLGREAKPERD
ncbi:NAD(P)H-dependent glycerol-3-phosphate dehydrogenase [Sciscionella sediminilitoris]|uniref:NAD(P)H-dependent glycerol-3-phosphate dehydrogenase n=1 Tax=Sciscionella sediminilitoris TaxID=1445613 RepID=UPI0004DF9362|nr:NAD(P)H-dependent glycerol-3-phosphate dehydrogenase [Sciscionella sp. SE31]